MEKFSLEPSPAVGKILDHLMETVLDDPSMNKEEILLKIANEFYKTKINTNTKNNEGTDA